MIEIVPMKSLNAKITVPGSKYIANRVLLIAGLAKGTSTIRNIPKNEDIGHVIGAMKDFGIEITVKDDVATIKGTGGKLSTPKKTVDVGHNGTLFRFITGIASLVGDVRITGSKNSNHRDFGLGFGYSL